ncbi:hypothetical protein VTK73DRAFT_3708 [Phialemonium thermophilum]|uniref:Urea carboxylase n=1 Tax=Phialemonium thermophilum TaxID=223376 RepID=A0ABR3WYK6_9PEZI
MSLSPRLLIVNRGEIAYRILKTAKRLGYHVASIYTPVDISSPHVVEADSAYPVTSYLNIREIINIIKTHDIRYVIPGYGFLSENEIFARDVEDTGAVFVGPTAEHIAAFGIKHSARDLAHRVGVPICPGSGIVDTADEAVLAAEKIGYPVMLKATAGGGGMGLQICENEAQVRSSFASVVSRGTTLFSNPGVFLERYYPISRHIEVQIFGDGEGQCLIFGERECSIQRRHQKVIEESPSPFVSSRPELRKKLFETSERLGRSIKYRSAGTIEYLMDDSTGDFFFLEMNTRLQVEHGITELRFAIDLVELMLRLAEGKLDLAPFTSIEPKGCAIEARIYAENPLRNNLPSPGVLQDVYFPAGPDVRVDTWVKTGTHVSLNYDPLVAKIMGYGRTRSDAVATITRALDETKLRGIGTNLGLIRQIISSERFGAGKTTTDFLKDFHYSASVMEILSPGAYTTVQDLPGRVGVGFGVPEAGPMDGLHAQLANLIVGNKPTLEHLEMTFSGPDIKFHCRAIFAVAGASVEKMTLDGVSIPMFTAIEAPSGSILSVGPVSGGCRAYLALKGGFPEIPTYLNSKATSPIAQIGGLQGRQLVAGDQIDLADPGAFRPFGLPANLIPDWDASVVYCLSGPHDSSDIITPDGLRTMYESPWTVSHQASRVGIRLHGPQPEWARRSGGEGGSHPSNYLDYPYPVGALNWTGDTAVLFPADAPSLGGFISSHVVPRGELYKIGQLRPGDQFHFVPITLASALDLRRRQDNFLDQLAKLEKGEIKSAEVTPLNLSVAGSDNTTSTAVLSRYGDVTIRQAGDSYIIVEFQQKLDLEVRCEVQAFMERFLHAKISGISLVTPMGCSFQISQHNLCERVSDLLREEFSSPQSGHTKLSSRIVKMPMVFDDEVNRASIKRYMETQRKTASYLPDPVEFIARSNGLASKEDVRQKVLSTRILVVGVGFFNGTPIGMPLDPRCRLIVPKFNPPRSVSPAGGLGFGGGFFSCDPIEAPGGYVNFGLSVPSWDKYCLNKGFNSRPWLLQSFDQIQLYEVTQQEFEKIETRFKAGCFEFEIEETLFDIDEYKRFCESVAQETAEFRALQKEATDKEIEREKIMLAEWVEEQKVKRDDIPSLHDIDDSLKIKADTHASVYKVEAQKGAKIKAGDVLLVLEAMKMEINLLASAEHEGMLVNSIAVGPSDIVKPGDTLILLSQGEPVAAA